MFANFWGVKLTYKSGVYMLEKAFINQKLWNWGLLFQIVQKLNTFWNGDKSLLTTFFFYSKCWKMQSLWNIYFLITCFFKTSNNFPINFQKLKKENLWKWNKICQLLSRYGKGMRKCHLQAVATPGFNFSKWVFLVKSLLICFILPNKKIWLGLY